MHIIHLIPEVNKGGVENIVCSLNKNINSLGYKSTVISSGGLLVKKIIDDGGNHIEFDLKSKNIFNLIKRITDFRRILKKINPTIIHVHSRVPAWILYFANKKLKIPTISSIHGFNHISFYSKIMTKFDHIICVSNAVKQYILSSYDLKEKEIDVIYCGIDDDVHSNRNVNIQELNYFLNKYDLNNKFIISSIGRFSSLKDFETFIKAININVKKNKDTIGVIIGYTQKKKSKYLRKINNLIIKNDLADKIHVITSLSNTSLIYKASNIIVSCSKKPESFGLTLVESLFFDTPVIATNHGGPLEIIEEYKNGLFFHPQNEIELSQKIDELRGLKFSNINREAKEKFSSKKMCQEYLTKYLNLIN